MIALAGGLAAVAAAGGTVAFADGSEPDATARPVAASAAAAKPELRTVKASTPPGTKQIKKLTVKCPSGFRAIGGGTSAAGQPAGSVVRTENRPFHTAAGDGYAATWRALPGAAGASWSVRASATCAKGLSNVQVVTGKKADPSDVPGQRLTATCPAGTVALGIGSKVVSADNDSGFFYFIKGEGLGEGLRTTYASPGISNESVTGPNWMAAIAVCAKSPEEMSANFWPSETTATFSKTGFARCPEGTRAYSAAADVESEEWPYSAHMESVGTTAGGGRATAKVGKEADGERPVYPWQLHVTTICAV